MSRHSSERPHRGLIMDQTDASAPPRRERVVTGAAVPPVLRPIKSTCFAISSCSYNAIEAIDTYRPSPTSFNPRPDPLPSHRASGFSGELPPSVSPSLRTLMSHPEQQSTAFDP